MWPTGESFVDAIIVAHNSDIDELDAAVTSLVASTLRPRITIVDNGSSPAIAHPLVDHHIRIAHNLGFAAAVNRGVAAAHGEFVLVLNDDVAVEQSMVERLVARLRAEPTDVVAAAPKVLLKTPEPVLDSCGIVIRETGEAFSAGVGQPDIGQFDDDQWCLGPCLSAALIRRSALRQLGGITERYFLYYEDVDFALRTYLSGLRTAFVADAVAYHRHAATTRRLGEPAKFTMTQRNLLLCATLNFGWPSILRIWSGRLLVALKGTGRAPMWRERWRALGQAARQGPSVLLQRHARRRQHVRSDAEAFAFADGLEPFISGVTFLPIDRERALRAAHDLHSRRPKAVPSRQD